MICTSFNQIALILSVALCTAAQSYAVQAGYHVLYSYSGKTIPDSIFQAAASGTIGGLILFGGNIDSTLPSQLSSLQSAYKQSSSYAGAPLLIVTDQEGGQVNRLPGGPTLSAKKVGQASDPAAAASSAGATVAQGFSTYKVNGNLAPVLGVYRSAGDFLDEYGRSYGMTASLVSKCVGPFISKLQSYGYAATAKHFPGLGAASSSENTDEAPVTINLSLSELRSVDEVPYQTAIANGVKMVMPSWAVYPALDSSRPSGLSSKWLKDELRGRLGFAGVTISDAITAGGLRDYGSISNRAVLAVQAGMDIIVVTGNSPADGATVVSALATAVQNGQIASPAFSGSSQRILNLRKALAT
jgi:beta-glucosidase-like glycosyl hydrolase